MKVILKNVTPIDLAVQAMRTCYASNHLSDNGEKDFELLKKAIRMNHHTPLEFINLTFTVEKLTRLVLMELSRHRTQTLNVQSTRYTLKKMKDDLLSNLNEYFYTDLPFYTSYLEMIIKFIEDYNLWELPNDKLKAYFPETLYCDLYLNVNFRNFLNFYKLRSDKKAHFLINELASEMYKELPSELKELVDLYMNIDKRSS